MISTTGAGAATIVTRGPLHEQGPLQTHCRGTSEERAICTWQVWVAPRDVAPPHDVEARHRQRLVPLPLRPQLKGRKGRHHAGTCSLFLSFSFFLSFFLSFFSFSLSLSLSVHCTRGRGLTFTLARVLVSSTYRWVKLATHRHQGTHNTSCAARALVPTLAAQPPHVCHRQGDWAVSIGSHMQQGHRHFQRASTSRRSAPLFEYLHVRKPRSKKLARISP